MKWSDAKPHKTKHEARNVGAMGELMRQINMRIKRVGYGTNGAGTGKRRNNLIPKVTRFPGQAGKTPACWEQEETRMNRARRLSQGVECWDHLRTRAQVELWMRCVNVADNKDSWTDVFFFVCG